MDVTKFCNWELRRIRLPKNKIILQFLPYYPFIAYLAIKNQRTDHQSLTNYILFNNLLRNPLFSFEMQTFDTLSHVDIFMHS